jgi:quinol monooxygenase YgiN
MFVAVIHLPVKPDKIEELKKLWGPATQEALKQKDLKNAILLTNQQKGDCLAVGFWESEQSARAFQSNPVYQNFVASIKDTLSGSPSRYVYDLTGDISGLEKKAA